MATLHYASGDVGNNGFDPAAAAAGFNLADVQDPESLAALPPGVKGLYYLDEAKGVTPSFIAEMNAIKGSPNLYAIYLADEPDPSKIKASDLRAESDWIHANMPGVKTFIVAENMGSNQDPSFNGYYTVESTHIDLWGLDPYPIRSEMKTPDYTEIDRTIIAAENQIGVSPENIVPVFQAFGGVNDGDNGKWVLPTPEQERAIMAEFAKFVPNPAFDYAYSWMKQGGDTPLSESAALQQVFKEHNAETGGSAPAPTDPVTPPPSTPTTPPSSGSGDEPGGPTIPQKPGGSGSSSDGKGHAHGRGKHDGHNGVTHIGSSGGKGHGHGHGNHERHRDETGMNDDAKDDSKLLFPNPNVAHDGLFHDNMPGHWSGGGGNPWSRHWGIDAYLYL